MTVRIAAKAMKHCLVHFTYQKFELVPQPYRSHEKSPCLCIPRQLRVGKHFLQEGRPLEAILDSKRCWKSSLIACWLLTIWPGFSRHALTTPFVMEQKPLMANRAVDLSAARILRSSERWRLPMRRQVDTCQRCGSGKVLDASSASLSMCKAAWLGMTREQHQQSMAGWPYAAVALTCLLPHHWRPASQVRSARREGSEASLTGRHLAWA